MKFGHTICKNAGKENKSSHILKSQLSFNYNSNLYKNGKNGQKWPKMTKNDQNDQKWYGLDKDVAKKTVF